MSDDVLSRAPNLAFDTASDGKSPAEVAGRVGRVSVVPTTSIVSGCLCRQVFDIVVEKFAIGAMKSKILTTMFTTIARSLRAT